MPVTALLVSCFSIWTVQVGGATFYWDADGVDADNVIDGTGLGGTGAWDTSSSLWWPVPAGADTTWGNTAADIAIFTSAFAALPTLKTVTLASGITANQLSFYRSGYTLTGGDITLAGATPTLAINLGESAVINSQLQGSDGLTKTGGGTIRLASGNTYTGLTAISNGALIITDQSALGTDASAIVVRAFNPYPTSAAVNLRGFGGGSLVLDGTGGDITISRDLSLQGRGPAGDNGAALVSTGNNTLSGTVDMGVAFGAINLNTRMIAADGTLNLTGPLNVLGTAATTISSLGGINQAGASFYNVTGVLAGTGTLEGSGGGTLFLNPTDSSGFSGTIRVSGSAASGQSVVRIDSPGVLGTRTNGTTGAVLDMNGGVLAVLMDTPDVKVSNGSNANVYFRASSTIFADHTPNSSVKDQTVAFGNMSYEDGITLTFNSRNGYGMSFTTAPVNGGNGDTTITNNLQGGALLSFTGNFWSNADNTGNRTMTIGGAGNTTINGSIIAAAAAYNHNLTKSGAGTLTITGTASTLDGNVSVTGGTVAINDWRSITNNTSTVSLNGGILSVIGNNVSLANLTTSKVINLSGTTGAATILANQTGTSPGVVLNADFTATGAGTKTLTLGGANIGANTINGAIVQNGSTLLTKIDAGRWILAGTNTYTGNTTISNGTLQLKANAAASTILADTSAIVFNATNVYAGGTLELVGQASTNNVETLGALTPTAGSGTVRLTPGSGGTASIIFASLGTVGGGGTVNIVAPTSSDTVKFTTTGITNNIANAGLYYNGSDFAFVPGAATALRAPNYASDTDFATTTTALTSALSMEITGAGFSNAAVTIDSLRINGATALNMTGLLTIRTAGTANATGGIIQTGGSGSISGTGVSTGGSGALVINVDGGANALSLDAPITATTTGGFTKVGAGTLRLGGTNAQTGTITINEGTVRLAGADRLGAAAALTIRQDGILELNGVTPATSTNAFNNNGIVRNTSATTDVTFTVGGGNGTGTSLGIIENGGAAKVNVVKIGTGNQSWLGLSTYTGTTTIGSTGIVSINNLQNGGMPSGIGASSNAAVNLIFNGTSTTQAYGGLSYTGTTNDETNRLFTFDGGADGGVRIQSNGVNGATSTWTNTGALEFGTNATNNPQGLVLDGGSTGDNRFSPIINDNPAGLGAATSVYKVGTGVWYLEATNGYSGVTELRGGALYVQDGTSLPTASNLVFNRGIVASTGTLSRTIGTGSGQMSFAVPAANTAAFRGGFAAGGSKLTVDWGSGNVWGSTANFIDTRDGLIFGAMVSQTAVAKSDVEISSDFSLGTASGAVATPTVSTTSGSSTVTFTTGTTAGLIVGQSISGTNIPSGAYILSINSATQISLSANASASGTLIAATVEANALRPIRVDDNTSIGADFATLSGVISGNAGTGIRKLGSGILVLSGANTYDGETNVNQGTLVVSSLGNSASLASTPTSVGISGIGTTFDNTNAITLGNGGTGAGILEYVGLGETSDRKIRLNTTTGSSQIHADGVGALILTNVANDMVAGAKTLFLRGVNSAGNMITSQLSNNGGNLAITVDGSATWILTNSANDYSGTTSVNGGALGIGHDNALGDGTGTLSISNGTVFAYGADRTISNPITQSATTGTIAGFTGDYSINLTGAWTDPSTTSSGRFIRNNIVSGKTLTLNGNYSATAGTTSLGIGFDGSGDTIVNGIISSTMPSFGVIYAGTGSLTLGGANTYTGKTRITSGTLRLGADEVIPNGAVNPANNEVVLDPGLVFTATLDLNGKTETVNGLTANAAGTAIIDNTSANAASLTFGANDSAVSFGGGIGTYTIQNSGGGALSITKTGTASATIPTGVTLTYTGTTGVSGGSLTIASALNGTTGLSVTNSGSTLALTGGITAPTAITSVVVENGGTLSLLDGAGNQLSMLTNLQLGSTGGTLTTLALNVGDITNPDMLATDTLTLLTGGTLSLFAGNQIRFDLTDAGLNGSSTYNLIDVTDGGLILGALGVGDWILGATPGGFASITLNKTDTLISITTGALITGTSYWRGALGGGTDTTWNANANNWSTDKAGTIAAGSTPGSGTDVVFQWDAPSNAAVVTTLEQNFKVNSLTFADATVVANTATSVTIDPGTLTTSRIEIAPQLATDGIKLITTNATSATISGAVKLGGTATGQTWEVTNAGSVLSLGSLFGEKDVTKTGAGKVTLTAAADPTFNSGVTSDFIIDAGTLEILNSGALGNTVNSNLATVTVNSGGAFYYNNTTASTVTTGPASPLTLDGGTLSAGGNTQFYNGTVNVSSNSFINMADSNGPAANTARSITLSGVVSGSGNLTIDSNNGTSGGNQFNGTLTMSNAGNSWTGDLFFNEGTVTIANLASPSFTTNDVTFNTFGRFNLQGLNGATLTRTGTLTYAAGAIGELGVDNTGAVVNSDFLVDQNGAVTLGSGGTGGNVRIYLSDAFSKLNVTGGVTLGGSSSISVGGDALGLANISSVISDGGSGYALAVNDDAGGWATTNRTLRLSGLNTFSGNLTVDSGILEFDTASTVAGSVPNSLGQGSAITMGAGAATLRFIGSTSQVTDRPITTVTGAQTLSANGTGGATITYAGAITVGPTADGTQLTLTGIAGSGGIISGGITQTLDTADMTVNGGTWTHQTGTSRIGDALTVTGADTIFNLNSGLFQVRNDIFVISGANLNLNATSALSFSTTTLSADASLRAYTGGIITLGADDAVVATDFDGLRIGTDGTGVGTLNMSTFNQTVTEFILGNRNFDRTGIVNGTGILTVTGNLDLYKGTINANLASTGATALEKIGNGTVTLTGDNSGLASTAATIHYEGDLVLDYTTSNTTKLRAASQLDMRGSNLILNGNASAATSQSVGSFTLGTGGSSRITLNPGAGQEIVLNLNAITRAVNAQDGAIRFVLPAGTQSATNGITTDTLNTIGTAPNAILGGWATVDNGSGVFFAMNATNAADANIIAATTTSQDAVGSWLTGENISDATGFTGSLNASFINSLRLNAASGSDLILGSSGVFGINSGGILVTSSVAGTPSIANGTLFSGYSAATPELIITQDSSQTFQIGADIRVNHAVFKTGAGTLLLNGNNVYTGVTEIQEGTLQVAGGNAIGDTSLVTLSASRPSTLELLADETIGRLQGGNRQTDSDFGTVAVGSNTLTINNSGANTTFAGFFTGDGNIIKQGTHNLNLSNISTGFTGVLTAEAGMLQMNGVGQINANIIRINKGGAMIFDNNGTTRSGTRVLDTTAITLNSADGTFNGQTIVRGLAIRTDQDTTLDETVGLITLNTGASYVGMEATTTNDDSDIIATNILRLNSSTLNVRGTNLGGTSSQENEFRIGDATNQAAFIANVANLVGGSGAAASQNISIVPWAIGESTAGALAATHMGNSLVTYVSGSGFRPLLNTEYNTFGTQVLATDNIRESLAAPLALASGPSKTINALVLHNASLAAATHAVTGAGVGESLAVTSGALLFTLDPTAVAGDYGITLGGFDSGITVGATNEYIIHVVNPDAGAPTKALTATISSQLTSTANITKSGRGTLILGGLNNAGGGANKTTINEGILEIADLDNIGGDTGALVFAGGTLRLGTGLTDDISLRTITLLDGGGTIDTNGIDLALANSVGSGLGGLAKNGLGNLTLNAAATYTGATVVSGGTLTVGANNATGTGGNLTILGGSTLDLGVRSITAGLVVTSGASPLISGTGVITSASGFYLNHTGDTTIAAILAGSASLLKAQTNIVTLSGANTYTGTTEVHAGSLSFDSIANVGGGTSALGAPMTVENGIIRVGLTTSATTLNYTGSGHTSDRIIGMQGTTGSVTLDADGTGALVLTGGVRFEMAGNKTLVLRGSSDASTIDNAIGGLTEIGGVLTLNKADSNTWLINGGNTYTGVTQIDNGTLKIGVNDALPTATTVRVGTGSTAGTLDLNGFDQTITSLLSQTNSALVTNNLIVDAGKTLTVTGAVTLGANVAASTTLFTASGGGSFVNNNDGGSFQIGGATGSTNTNAATVNFSALATFTVDLGAAGIFRVGDNSSVTSAGPGISDLTLAADNTITAGTIHVASTQSNTLQRMHLGSATNILKAGTLDVGGSTRGIGLLDFASGTGTMSLRAVNGVDRAVMNIGVSTTGTGSNLTGTVDFSGHDANLLISTLTMADRSAGTGAGASATTATMTFDDGVLDVTTLILGQRTGAGTGNATATLNLGDSVAPGTPTTTIGAVTMATNTSAGGVVNSTLNVTGGNVGIGSINMANAAASRTVTSNINLTGGTTTLGGNITRTGGAGTENATVTLNGGTLDMAGFGIGSANVITFAAQSGTLRNLGTLNAGGTLTKTTAGTLIVEGTNTYVGATVISDGTFQVGSGGAGSVTGTASVTVVKTGATYANAPVLSGSGTVGGATVIGDLGDAANKGILAPGDSASSDNKTLTFTPAGGVTVAAGSQVQMGITSATGFDLTFSTSGLSAAAYLAGLGSTGDGVMGTAPAAWFDAPTAGEVDHLALGLGSLTLGTNGGLASTGEGIMSIFSNSLVLGSLANGQIFNLVDWTGIFAGSFDAGSGTSTGGIHGDFDLPDISSTAFSWDTSAFTSHGVLAVASLIPEPSRMMLLFFGFFGLFFRRRRNGSV